MFPLVLISMPPSESAHSYLSSAFGGTLEETVGITDWEIPFETTSLAVGVVAVDCGTTESDFAQAPRTQE